MLKRIQNLCLNEKSGQRLSCIAELLFRVPRTCNFGIPYFLYIAEILLLQFRHTVLPVHKKTLPEQRFSDYAS